MKIILDCARSGPQLDFLWLHPNRLKEQVHDAAPSRTEQTGLFERDFDFGIATRRHRIDRGHDFGGMGFD